MQVVGLTGSIAMGKTHAANLFRRFAIPVFDSDAAVHRMFAPKGGLPRKISQAFGDVLDDAGGVDRRKLGEIVLAKSEALKRLEAIVHPAVFQAQKTFLSTAARQGFARAVLDIPLLFEGGHRHRFDAVLLVVCHKQLQAQRALRRPNMTRDKLNAILSKQMPVHTKVKNADWVIASGYDRGHAHSQIARALDWLDRQPSRAWPQCWR